MRRPFASIGLIVMLLGFLSACASPPSPTATALPTVTLPPTITPLPLPTATVGAVPQTMRSDPSIQGSIRVVQAAPGSSAVDVYLEQSLIASRFALGAYTNPTQVASGEYTIQVVPAGARSSTQILASETITIEPQQAYLIMITGTPDALIVSIFEQDVSPVSQGQARLMFINGVPRGPLTTPTLDGQPIGSPLDFGRSSETIVFDEGTHQLDFGAGDEMLAQHGGQFSEEQIYTAILLGQVGGGEYRVLLLDMNTDASGIFRVVHANPETDSIDVYLGNNLVVEGLSYREASPWMLQRATDYDLRVVTSGSIPGDAPLVTTRLSLNPHQTQEVMLLAERNRPAVRVYAHSGGVAPALKAYLVVVNAAPQQTSVYARAGTERLTEIPTIPYGLNSPLLEIPAGPMNLTWYGGTGANEGLIERAGEIIFEEGHSYTYVITGADSIPFLLDTDTGQDTAIPGTVVETETTANGDRVFVRVLNALAEPVNLRIRMDSFEIVNELGARLASPYISLAENRYALRVGLAGESANAPSLYVGEVSFLNRRHVSLLLYGQPEQMQVSVLADYVRPAQLSEAVLRIIHALPGEDELTTTIDLPGIAEAGSSEINLAHQESRSFGLGESALLNNLARGTYDLRITRTTGGEVLAIVPQLALESRTIYDLLLLPEDQGEGFAIELLALESPN